MLSLWDLIGKDEDQWTQPTSFPPRSNFVSMETPILPFEDHCQPPPIPRTPPPDYASFWSICPEEDEKEKEPDSFYSKSWIRVVKISDEPFEKKFEREERRSQPTIVIEEKKHHFRGKPEEEKNRTTRESKHAAEKKKYWKTNEQNEHLNGNSKEKKRKITEYGNKYSKSTRVFNKPLSPIDRKSVKFESRTLTKDKTTPIFKKFTPPSDRKSMEFEPTVSIKDNICFKNIFWHETDVLILHPEPDEYREFNEGYEN